MFAFLIFSTIFSLPLCLCMWKFEDGSKYPHEFVTVLIQTLFMFFEIITSIVVLYEQGQARTASFNLRVAPILDPKFKKKYANANDINSTREVQLGVQKYDPERDLNADPFGDSERHIN